MTSSQKPMLAKLREARRLTEAARWTLLDAVVAIQRLEADLIEAEVNGEPQSGLLGEDESHEDYQPGDGDECSGGR